MLTSLLEGGFHVLNVCIRTWIVLDNPGVWARCGGSAIFLYHWNFQRPVYSSLRDHGGHLNEFIMWSFLLFFRASGSGFHELLF